MPKEAWICNVCETHYSRREAADDCEKSHLTLEQVELKGLLYAKTSGMHGSERDRWQRYPSEVLLAFKDRPGDYARYRFWATGSVPINRSK